jgi:type III secretory pathway lipoprotein EscJ
MGVLVFGVVACQQSGTAPGGPAPSASTKLGISGAAARPTSLLPSRLVELAQLETEKSREIELTLATLPDVTDARVHLVLPTPAPLLGDAPAKPGKAAVLLQYRGALTPLQASDVQRLVAGATRGIEPDDVQVVLRRAVSTPPPEPTRAQPELVRFGPISVERGSANLARVVLGVAALTGLTLTAVLCGMWLTLRRRDAR